MKTYYRIMLGAGSVHAATCFAGNFIGADYGIEQDLTGRLPDEWSDFNTEFIPVYLAKLPAKSRVAAGLACGTLWTVAKGMQIGDIVLCPDGNSRYHVGEISSGYVYSSGAILPHRRQVKWLPQMIDRADMSDGCKRTTGAIGTVVNLSRAGYADEIEKFLGLGIAPQVIAIDPRIENPFAFVMEKHLEDFLIGNWGQTELGKSFDIYTVDGEPAGQQVQTDTGRLDILAISKDRRQLLVVELKKGMASDVVVGQILRYMGYVQDALAEPGQSVRGIIIALEDDQRIRRAIRMTPAIEFFRYQVSFKLVKTENQSSQS